MHNCLNFLRIKLHSCGVYMFLKGLQDFKLIMHLLELEVTPSFLVLSIASHRCRSWVRSSPKAATSSPMPTAPCTSHEFGQSWS